MARDTVLIVTRDFDPPADVLVDRLRQRKVKFERIHPENVPTLARLTLAFGADGTTAAGFAGPGVDLDFATVKSVWYRRIDRPTLPEGMRPDEAEFAAAETVETVLGAFRTLDAFWVNHPDRVRAASSKPWQTRVAGELGFAVPRTLFTNDPEALKGFWEDCGGRVVYKTMTQGKLGVDVLRMVYTSRLDAESLARADLLANCPGLFQELVEKRCDLRITVIGGAAYTVEIHSQDHPDAVQDWRRVEAREMTHAVHDLPAEVEARCIALTRRLGLHYGAIDMILTPEGEYVFLEINPSGQYAWIDQMTDLRLTDKLIDLLVAAG